MADPSGHPEHAQRGATTSSPTPSPPLGMDPTDAELRLSRKREREVSLEPVGTPTASQDNDAAARERKDSSTRTPAKKNRRRLDPTVEEDDTNLATRSRSHSVSPPLPVVVSPRAEMRIKVRQISQGVGDLNWRNMQPQQGDGDEPMHDDENRDDPPAGERLQEAAVIVDSNAAEKHTDASGAEAIVVDPPREESADEAPRPDIAVQAIPDTKETGAGHLAVTSDSTLRSDTETGAEKGLKRKFLERGTSQGPGEDIPASSSQEKTSGAEEGSKDATASASNADGQSERTSPPSPKVPKLSGFMAYAAPSSPFANVKGNVFASSSKPSLTPSSSAPALSESSSIRSGFDSYAGSASPFASVSREKTPVVENQQPAKRSGFGAFAGSSSPFASVARSKSPALGGSAGGPSRLGRAKSPGPRRNNSFSSNPFGSYASGGAHAFGSVPSSKSLKGDDTFSSHVLGTKTGSSNPLDASSSTTSVLGKKSEGAKKDDEDTDEADSEEATQDATQTQGSTFGERLRAAGTGLDQGDAEEEEADGPKIALEEQDVITGEEDEDIMIQVRGKLFALDGNSWKERGTGIMRLLVKRTGGTGARLVMRKDAVYSLLLNAALFAGMKFTLAQDPRYVRFSVLDSGKTTHYNFKASSYLVSKSLVLIFLQMSNAKIAQEFLEEVNVCLPSA